MMNADDLAFNLVMAPFSILKVKYEVKKEGAIYTGVVPIRELRNVFKKNLGMLSAVKMDDNVIQLMKTGDLSNIVTEETEEGIKIKLGDIAELTLTDDQLIAKLNETFREQFGPEVTVTREKDVMKVTVANPSRILTKVLTSDKSPLKLEGGKLVFKT